MKTAAILAASAAVTAALIAGIFATGFYAGAAAQRDKQEQRATPPRTAEATWI